MGIIERAHAAVTDVLTINTDTSKATSLDDLITKLVAWVSLIVGLLAFIYLVYAGILYITAAGNPEQAKKGQQGIIYAIIGIVIAVLAYTIVSVIGDKAANLGT